MKRRLAALTIELRSPLDAEVLAIFDRLPPSDAPTDLLIEVAEAPDRSEVDALIASNPPVRHGSVRGYFQGPVQADSSVVARVTDGDSILEVGSNRILVRLSTQSLTDGYTFRSTTVFFAVVLAVRRLGWFHHHAASIVSARGSGVLVLGEGGAGKTTTTLACLERGFAYGSDDACFVTQDLDVVPAPSLFHVGERTARAFPRVGALLGPAYRANNDKRSLDPRRAFPGRERERLAPPRLLVVPRLDADAITKLEPWSMAETLGALLTSAAFVVVDGMPYASEQLEVERRLATSAKGFELSLGADALADPAIVPRLILSALGETS
ncbi:MAG: hypothetical protein HYV07_18175 [Deltaproteobacteria bacterium]|nr:hypothetical protein [Deltaproteobacteria bacterium]